MSKMSSNTPQTFSAEGLLVDLANLLDKEVSRFIHKWDRWFSRYSSEEILTRRDELRLFWTYRLWESPEEPYEFTGHKLSKQEIKKRQQERRRWSEAWYAQHPEALRPMIPERVKKLFSDHEDAAEHAYTPTVTPELVENLAPLEAEICEHWLKLQQKWWRVIWEKNRKTIGTQPRCLPAMLAVTCLRVFEHLGFCRNPKCAKPYFFIRRRDQLYCSTECAKPAKRASKLKWWHERRGKKAVGVVIDPMLLTSPRKQRHTPLRPPVRGKKQGGKK